MQITGLILTLACLEVLSLMAETFPIWSPTKTLRIAVSQQRAVTFRPLCSEDTEIRSGFPRRSWFNSQTTTRPWLQKLRQRSKFLAMVKKVQFNCITVSTILNIYVNLFFRKEEIESQGIYFLALVHQSSITELRCSKLSVTFLF